MKQLQTAMYLINQCISETATNYSDRPNDLRTYAWDWRSIDRDDEDNFLGGAVGSVHGTSFYYMEDVIPILEACHCTYYMTIEPNADGVPTPCIRFF